MEKYRSQKHLLLLYPDCPEHVAAFAEIKKTFDYAAILHDKDKTENGDLKKPHWHVVLVTPHQTWNTAIAKDLNIPLNYIEKVRSYELCLEYLIHFNEPQKHQYSFEEIEGTKKVKDSMKRYLEENEITEGEKVLELIEFIDNADKNITIASFARFCALSGRWDVFRRAGGIFCEMIREKNKGLQIRQEYATKDER